jgi:hypothetical protein
MKQLRFEITLAAICVALFVAVFVWQTPSLWQKPMSRAEIDQYMVDLDTHIALPAVEKAKFIARVRTWATMDDGKPVVMLNMMRYHPTLGSLPPTLAFSGTPVQANAKYEKVVAPLAAKRGEYPLLVGMVQGANLVGYDPALDHWDHIALMRAPSRRAFIEFMADPDYGPVAPLKTAAAEVLLIPVTPELVIPELRFAFGGALLILYCFTCWMRALGTRSGPPPAADQGSTASTS